MLISTEEANLRATKSTQSRRKSMSLLKEKEEYLIGQAKLNWTTLDPEENGEKSGGDDEGPGDRGIVCEKQDHKQIDQGRKKKLKGRGGELWIVWH